MSEGRVDAIVIVVGLLLWAAIFAASAQGKLGVSSLVSDGILALVGAVIAYRLWRAYRRGSRKRV